MRRIIIFLVTLAFVYLVGAFVNISFDISNWSFEFRSLTAILGCFFALGLATFPNLNDM